MNAEKNMEGLCVIAEYEIRIIGCVKWFDEKSVRHTLGAYRRFP